MGNRVDRHRSTKPPGGGQGRTQGRSADRPRTGWTGGNWTTAPLGAGWTGPGKVRICGSSADRPRTGRTTIHPLSRKVRHAPKLHRQSHRHRARGRSAYSPQVDRSWSGARRPAGADRHRAGLDVAACHGRGPAIQGGALGRAGAAGRAGAPLAAGRGPAGPAAGTARRPPARHSGRAARGHARHTPRRPGQPGRHHRRAARAT